jgi:hypothetical protein
MCADNRKLYLFKGFYCTCQSFVYFMQEINTKCEQTLESFTCLEVFTVLAIPLFISPRNLTQNVQKGF